MPIFRITGWYLPMVLSQEQLQRAFCDGAGKFIFAQLPLI
jgi:hypothetical protein